MQCILLATDGSKTADRAADFAAQLAKSTGATLWIVNVTDDLGMAPVQLDAFSRVEHVSRQEMIKSLSTQILARIKEQMEKRDAPAVHIESRKGDVAQTIIELADEKHADAIVIGKRGHGKLAGLLVGSVAQKLVSLARVTVIVVP